MRLWLPVKLRPGDDVAARGATGDDGVVQGHHAAACELVEDAAAQLRRVARDGAV